MIAQQHLRNMNAERRAKFIEMHKGKNFSIWSDEHKAWWREGANGYTDQQDQAGKMPLLHAWEYTMSAGAEKRLYYVEVP